MRKQNIFLPDEKTGEKYDHSAGIFRGFTEGNYAELFREDEKNFAFVRQTEREKAVILINFSTAPAFYDPSCLEGAELLLSSAEANEPGALSPLEAAIYLIR